jgi:glycine C-acetyltransferase
MTVAAVLAGLEVIEREPERRAQLHENVRYLLEGLRSLRIDCHSQSAIVPVRVPEGADIRRLGKRFDDAGIFLNAVEYPAVPRGQERFRLSLSSEHNRFDLDRLLAAFAGAYRDEGII